MESLTISGVFLAGLISFLSPCVLPLVPPYLCYLAGTTLDQISDEEGVSRTVYFRIVLSAILFVVGFTTVFIFLGASATSIGQFLVSYPEWLSRIAGVIIVIMGLHFLGVFRIPLLNRDTRYHGDTGTGTYLGAYFMGIAFAFGWTPCIGPVLGAILFVAAGQETVGEGMGLLAIYSLGLGLPFILAAAAVRPFLKFAAGFRQYLGHVEKFMGGMLVLFGILFFTGSMSNIAYWLLEHFPALSQFG